MEVGGKDIRRFWIFTKKTMIISQPIVKKNINTSRRPVILLYLCLWSVTWRQLEINPREIAADHWRCSCSCWSNHSKRNFEAAALTVWAVGGKTWQKEINDIQNSNASRNESLMLITWEILQWRMIVAFNFNFIV